MCYKPSRQRRTAVTGRCDHCEWTAITTSYPEMVKFYQDHLRASHPKAWLRV
ncbi:hypothetical protein [Salinigranum rubrum]|uniref:hypothetical protein n=1 Tax=Salinigranum rubrum TaxID=755307 RepID=UPI0015713D50|nr:hypothetical protein [Salinigranum rubrum]